MTPTKGFSPIEAYKLLTSTLRSISAHRSYGLPRYVANRKEHTMLKKTIALAALLAGLAVPALASDDDGRSHTERYEHRRSEHDGNRSRCSARPAAEWLSADQVAQKLKEQGYAVTRIETSHGCYEVKATDGKGVRVEMYVDPATADVPSTAMAVADAQLGHIGHGNRPR